MRLNEVLSHLLDYAISVDIETTHIHSVNLGLV